MKTRIGFKVLLRTDKLISAFPDNHLAAVTYHEGRWVKPRPNCGPLAVFDNELDARAFASCSVFEVWKCEYEPSRGKSLFYKQNTGSRFRPYWRKFKRGILGMARGTAFARQVKLLRRIQ